MKILSEHTKNEAMFSQEGFAKNANGGSLPSLTVAYTTLSKFHLRPYMQILYAKHRENRIIKLNEAPHVPPSTKQNFSQGRED